MSGDGALLTWYVLAPGPTLTRQLADQVQGRQVCAVCNAYQLAPWASILVANDRGWWTKHPEAARFPGRRFSANRIDGVERVNPCTFGSPSNSGVVALDVLRNLGARKLVLLGFDSHGTHFFGPYTNGLTNTPERRRREHRQQFRGWALKNPGVTVVNCTPGSLLDAFPRGALADHL